MDILLINPACRLPSFLPLGLGYIASVLRENGHDVSMLDINGFGYSDEEVEDIIKKGKFDVVGIGGLSSTYKYVKWLSHVIKMHKPSVPIIAGNMVATAHPELLLEKSKVDIAVIDEGELTTKDLISAISSGRPLREVRGIFYKKDGDIVSTPARERITDLDSLPLPARDLFPMEVYLNNSTASSATCGLRTINISTVRGCPYGCLFCSHPFGRKVYTRSAKSVLDEIKYLKQEYRIEFIYFIDDLFLVDERWASEVCERLNSEKLNLKWSASVRVNLVNAGILRKMRKAGCVEVSYGFESGSQIILDGIKKSVTVKQAEEAIKLTRAAGIKVSGSFIFGLPGETRETIRDTLAFIKRTRLPNYRFFYATPFPKTELYKLAKMMGRFPQDEDKYLESLGEMWKTFLVNLTSFSDEELVRLKNLAQKSAKRNLSLDLRIEEFIEDTYRRYIIIKQSLKDSGVISTAKLVFLKVLSKFLLLFQNEKVF